LAFTWLRMEASGTTWMILIVKTHPETMAVGKTATATRLHGLHQAEAQLGNTQAVLAQVTSLAFLSPLRVGTSC